MSGKLSKPTAALLIILVLIFSGCKDDGSVSSATAGHSGSTKNQGIGFSRINEPNESAFNVLVPHDWRSEGGIFRVNANEAGGPLNALAAKCDLTFKSDPHGSVMFHIVPDIVYAHHGIGGGMWQPGSVYQGAVVRPIESAEQHVMALFQYLHPQATDVKTIEIRKLPWEIDALRKGNAYTNQLLRQIGGQAMTIQVDAAGAVLDSTESGVRNLRSWPPASSTIGRP